MERMVRMSLNSSCKILTTARCRHMGAGASQAFWNAPISQTPPNRRIGDANLPWGELGFDYVPTAGHWKQVWKNGVWEEGQFVEDPYLTVHILANVFHYGQALFEGFKVFHMADRRVCTFFDRGGFDRMSNGCRRFRMPMVTPDIWTHSIDETIRGNIQYVPPYGSNGSLYMRPFIFGSGPKLGLGPSNEFTFVVFSNPVGSYYRAGKMEGLDALVNDEYDRAAPLGSGDCKAAGNYAADLESMHKAKSMGFPISLYLDSKERKYVEEFNTSNFVAITKDGKYITPYSPRSVLDSNTNRVLRQLAADMNMPVEVRPIDFEAEVDNFAEVGAVGTAVVVTPIKSFTRGEKKWQFGETPVLQKLHDAVRAIQVGEKADTHELLREVSVDTPVKADMSSVYPGL